MHRPCERFAQLLWLLLTGCPGWRGSNKCTCLAAGSMHVLALQLAQLSMCSSLPIQWIITCLMSHSQVRGLSPSSYHMHGLILETSIWLLAGSTRYLPGFLRILSFFDWRKEKTTQGSPHTRQEKKMVFFFFVLSVFKPWKNIIPGKTFPVS